MKVVMESFETFAAEAEPKLRRAFAGALGVERQADAVAEALAYGWEEWDKVRGMEYPLGYLFRVGQSRTRPRKPLRLPRVEHASGENTFEPGLPAALMALPDTQRTAVWLAHGCRWSHQEIAEVLDVSSSTVSTHVNRGLERLRKELGVQP